MSYEVLSLHLFQSYQDAPAGVYRTERGAINKAKRVIDRSLQSLHQPGMSPEQLSEAWARFGNSAVVIGIEGSPACEFRGQDYARERAAFSQTLASV